MIKIHWWDSYGHWTCHRNEPGLSFSESLLGEVYEDDYGWYYVLSGSVICEERYQDCERARKALLKAVGGDPVNVWD